MQQYSLADVITAIAERLKNSQEQYVPPILYPAMDQFPDNSALWYYAGMYFQRSGMPGMAVECWEKSFQLEPQGQILSSLGAVLKDTGRPLEARSILQRGLDLLPDDQIIYANLVGSYVNEGEPTQGIAYGERSLGLGHQNRSTMFNLGLLQLEVGNFGRGFDLYADGVHHYRDKRSYEGAQILTRANFETAKGKRLIVFGEQGIGDELMFATMLEQVTADFAVTFDCHPRLVGLHESAPWASRLTAMHPTRKTVTEWYQPGMADYYTAIGNLGQFYRRTAESFAWNGPYYFATQAEVDYNRFALKQLAEGKKLIGIAFRGGSLKTARTYRIIPPSALDPLLKREDLVFVNLDYEDMTNICEWVTETYGPGKMYWYPSIGWAWDYDHLGALMAACDQIVTVCQSAAHLAAAMGLTTRVLTPSRPAWRYGVRKGSGDPWYWYDSGKAFLHRQQGEGEKSWELAIAEINEAIQ